VSSRAELSERQRRILARVVEEYVATSQPVGSRSLVERSEFAVSASTVRAELAELERIGLLTHPHTSAGRVPTEAGYRLYADELLERQQPRPSGFPLELATPRDEVEEALQATTEVLSQLTRLLALVSAPPIEAATVRHVDVLQLQANVIVVVVITSAGEVTKQRYMFPESVDAGLVVWAGDYLRERLTGLRLRSRQLARAFDEPGLSPREQAFLSVVRSSFDRLEDERELYVGGAAGLLDDLRTEEIGAYRSLIDALEKRATLLAVLAQSVGNQPVGTQPSGSQRPFVLVGGELQKSGLQRLALVGASYGSTSQALGTVSLLGPLRMDYETALRTVRAAAHELSRFVVAVYDAD
jgi:heat-inducible transcriptional repressor